MNEQREHVFPVKKNITFLKIVRSSILVSIRIQ